MRKLHNSVSKYQYKYNWNFTDEISSNILFARKEAYLMSLHTSHSKEIYNFHIRKAMDYTKNNYHKDLSLDYISSYLNLNKCYFCDLFKKETGKTYSRFLNEVRIEKSKSLLLNTNLSVLEVALSVGYNNQNYYNMSFKRLTGITPLKYRNMPV